jgi:8-oxo-dGTP pyrophosphatase MutT (NUDIX family)
MFYFYADKTGVLKTSPDGVQLKARRLFPDLRSAEAKDYLRILVVETEALPETPTGTKIGEVSLYKSLENKNEREVTVPESAIRNLEPYQSPLEVEAGGGVVTKMKKGKLRVLLIHRKGVWDLPKGKLEKGETVAECARREVREELGISNLKIVKPLDVTVHVYSEDRRLKVKTTHWYQMTTKASEFTPEKREGITEVKWFSYKKAKKAVAYKNLRKLLGRVEPVVAEPD